MGIGDLGWIAGNSRNFAAVAMVSAAIVALSAAAASAAAPEAPVTEAATVVTGTTATLHGTLNPGASATVSYDFTYARGESCTEGATTPEGGPVTGKAIKVSTSVSELEADTEYSFCLVANLTEGELTESTSGAPQSFKTLASAPVVASASTSAVTPFGATLEAQINPENEVTASCTFEYGETTAYGSSAECSPATLEGAETQLASAAIAALEPGTAYHFRAVVANATGTTKGVDGEFSTLPLEAPIVSGESVSELTSTHATLRAQVNPNYQETTYSFEYGTSESLAGVTTVAGIAPLPAEFAELPVSTSIGSLAPSTTYFYRVTAENGTGKTEGPVEQFTTTAVPVVSTGEAARITRTSATVTGTVNPAGAPSGYSVVYATQADYEAALASSADPYGRSTATAALPASYETQAVGPILIDELEPGTTYHYAVRAANAVGMTTGNDGTFTTAPATPPIVTTGGADGITQNTAAIHGSIDTRGLATISQFELGTSPLAGSLVSANVDGASGTVLSVSASFGNLLQPGVTYYYRAVARNRDGTTYGSESSLTTAAFPPIFTLAPALAVLPNPDASSLESKPGTGPVKLTNKQKLAKALKACAKKPKKKRAACRRSAQKKFGTHRRK